MITRETLDSIKPKVRTTPLDMTAEWGITVFVKCPTGEDEIALRTTEDLMRHQICVGLCDEEGNCLYHYPEDVDALNKFPTIDLMKIFEAINDCSTLRGKVNHAKKN